jgi:hypothetical protein
MTTATKINATAANKGTKGATATVPANNDTKPLAVLADAHEEEEVAFTVDPSWGTGAVAIVENLANMIKQIKASSGEQIKRKAFLAEQIADTKMALEELVKEHNAINTMQEERMIREFTSQAERYRTPLSVLPIATRGRKKAEEAGEPGEASDRTLNTAIMYLRQVDGVHTGFCREQLAAVQPSYLEDPDAAFSTATGQVNRWASKSDILLPAGQVEFDGKMRAAYKLNPKYADKV